MKDLLKTVKEIHVNLTSVNDSLSLSIENLFKELLEVIEPTGVLIENVHVTCDPPDKEYAFSVALHKITKEGELIVSNEESLIADEEDRKFEIDFSDIPFRDRLYIIELMIEHLENVLV